MCFAGRMQTEGGCQLLQYGNYNDCKFARWNKVFLNIIVI